MPPTLPGFYYDTEKKKYFKIQPNHTATPGSASKYTKAAVKKGAEEQRQQKRRRVFEQRERQMRAKRSRVLESPLSGRWGVTRELGLTRLGISAMTRAWAQGLQRKEVSHFRHQDGGAGAFVFDMSTGVLTHAEVLRGNGANASFYVFVYILTTTSGGGWMLMTGISGGMLCPALVIWEGAVGLLSWV